MRRLERGFFERPAVEVARDLLGARLVHRSEGTTTSGTVVEAEAYMGVEDRGSHAFGGRRTPRNEVLWGPAGHAYVYQIYGMHRCFNVVCGREGEPQGAFVRAAEPVEGIGAMARRRGLAVDERSISQLCNGPSKLCQAFGITLAMNGMDVCGGELYFLERRGEAEVITSRRIGIDYAGPDRERPWRFMLKGSAFVSRKA